jgi:hypothetical protein
MLKVQHELCKFRAVAATAAAASAALQRKRDQHRRQIDADKTI